MSNSTVEIERKYTAKIIGAIPVHEVVWSTQGYIAVRPKWEWRIRKLDKKDKDGWFRDTWYTAIKIGNGFVRREFETKIPAWFGRFLMSFIDEPINKRRTHSHGWEIDEFIAPSRLNGLVLVEAEIADVSHDMPPLPSGIKIIEDVTEHGGYSNKNLYRYGLPKGVTL